MHFNPGPRPPSNLEVYDVEVTQLSIRWRDEDMETTEPVVKYQLHANDVSVTVDRDSGIIQGTILRQLQSNTQYNIRVISLTATDDPIIQSDDSHHIIATTSKLIYSFTNTVT